MRREYLSQKWNVSVFENLQEALDQIPDFIVLCLPIQATMDIMQKSLPNQIPILTETCPATSEEMIQEFWRITESKFVQIAEQYQFQPMHAARLSIIESGLLGNVRQVQISVAHGYHAISLIRRYLHLNFEDCGIWGKRFISPSIRGPGRNGYPHQEEWIQETQDHIILDFGEKWAVFDFTDEQYFSKIRTSHLLIRGEKGEIADEQVSILQDYHTPLRFHLHRVYEGLDNSLTCPHTEAITGAGQWFYRNPLGTVRLSDEEVAVATVLTRMYDFVNMGKPFYSVNQYCQDQYLALLMELAVKKESQEFTLKQKWMS